MTNLFAQEVYNRLRQLPVDEATRNSVDTVELVARAVAEDLMRDCPEALEEVGS